MKGAEIIVKVLQEQKVDTVFGYPGGTIAISLWVDTMLSCSTRVAPTACLCVIAMRGCVSMSLAATWRVISF